MKLSTQRIVNVGFAVAFGIAAMWLLAIDGANYLRKIDLLSIFLSTNEYFSSCMARPGGLLTWCATFLTQTFYYPWLGGAIYTVLLLAMAWLAMRAFRLGSSLFTTALVIPAVVLLCLLNFGYLILSLKTPGFAFLLPLGVIAAILAFWGYRILDNWALRLAAMLIIAAGGYCLGGFYGLLAAGLCTALELARLVADKSRSRWQCAVAAAAGVLAIIFVPKAWFCFIGGELPMALIYKNPLPYFYEGEGSLWIPYIVLFAFLGILALLSVKEQAVAIKGKAVPVMAAMGVVAIGSIFAFRYTDRNFRLTLDLDNALNEGNWDKAIDIAWANQDIEPTRVNVILSDIALIRTRRAGDQMFKLRTGSAPYRTTRSLRATHDAASMMLSYHTGLVNYAYRWAMEYKVEYGMSVERLKFMVKTALLNKDYALARKSLDTLSKTTLHRKWAEKYYPYLDNLELVKQDPELGSVKTMMGKEDKFIEDGNTLEGYVWKELASIDQGQYEQIELSLLAAMICFRPDLFAERAPVYAQLSQRLPVHIQEAVLMQTVVGDPNYARPFKIDEPVKQRFEQFMQMYQQTSHMGQDEQRELMRERFGDTYWYYGMFGGDMKII